MGLTPAETLAEGFKLEHWRASSPQSWVCRDWDEGTLVLFNENSGSTHLLSQDGAEVIFELAKEPHGLTIAQLTDRLFDLSSNPDERHEAELALNAALLEFNLLGLAEPLTS